MPHVSRIHREPRATIELGNSFLPHAETSASKEKLRELVITFRTNTFDYTGNSYDDMLSKGFIEKRNGGYAVSEKGFNENSVKFKSPELWNIWPNRSIDAIAAYETALEQLGIYDFSVDEFFGLVKELGYAK